VIAERWTRNGQPDHHVHRDRRIDGDEAAEFIRTIAAGGLTVITTPAGMAVADLEDGGR